MAYNMSSYMNPVGEGLSLLAPNGGKRKTNETNYNWTPYDVTPVAPTDPYAGNPYTGNQTYAPPQANPEDYWTGTGYSQMPEYDPKSSYQPYDVAAQYNYAPVEGSSWENANTYAPWSGFSPGGNDATGYELMNQPGYSATGGYNGSKFDWERALSPMAVLGGFGGMALGGLFGKKKKSPTFNFSAPSYQGTMFTPYEGFAPFYNPSQETQNQTQADLYTQQSTQPLYEAPQAQAQPNSYDYNYTGGGFKPNYVGQQDQNYGSLYDDQNNSLYQTYKPTMGV